jgi:hypothetical protein
MAAEAKAVAVVNRRLGFNYIHLILSYWAAVFTAAFLFQAPLQGFFQYYFYCRYNILCMLQGCWM